MGKKPETKFREKFRALLNKIPNCWVESIQQKTIGGTPDLLLCVNGFFVGLELKAADGIEPSALQRLKLEKIAQAGGLGIVVSPGNAQHVLELIADMAKGEK